MRLQILFALLTATLFADTARAEALAPVPSAGRCLAANIEAQQVVGSGETLYRIAFVNRCDLPRSFFWCAENPGAQVPAAIACPRAGGFPVEPRHQIVRRKEFQWHLPPGSRVRFHDCAARDIPTSEFGCDAPPR
jgi:hypothetical protein